MCYLERESNPQPPTTQENPYSRTCHRFLSSRRATSLVTSKRGTICFNEARREEQSIKKLELQGLAGHQPNYLSENW
jgi:hypothetical protein